ncbi:DUF1929 domain-containing protein [Herbidospora yilanensis]|uniref:DUF1929 domain-containing protein n=1 Tax=Herbidospora yilanensis TaxID=354426 RepID=UPI000784CC70|nr:DUF1929 domain-containing protein [Herbidospora yilanensis]
MSADKGAWSPPRPVPHLPGVLRDKNGQNPVPDDRGLFVIHAVLLHTGKVLWFCGHAEYLDYPLEAYVFDPRNPGAPAVRKPFLNGADLFCCFCVQLQDGRILVVGGSQLDHFVTGGTFNPRTDYRGSAGSSTIHIFDPRMGKKGGEWVKPASGPKLLQGRWYPTAVVLGDGSVLVISGRREEADFRPAPAGWPVPKLAEWVTNRGIAQVVEHLKPPDYQPKAVTGADRMIPIYPGIHLAPDDRLYTTHTTWGQEIDEPPPHVPPTLSLTVRPAGGTLTGAWTEYVLPTARATQPEREEGMSVMLPVVLNPATKQRDPTSVGKFLVVGGGKAVDATGASLVRRPIATPVPPWTITRARGLGPLAFRRQSITTRQPVEILDTSIFRSPRWSAVPGLNRPPRINCHCVLLPDATVLILGGHDAYKWHAKANSTEADAKGVPKTTPTLEVEIFTPGGGFHLGAPMRHPRMYHSIAMLLPDGSVIVAGGADPNEHEPSLRFPSSFNGRVYPGTSRLLAPAPAHATVLEVDMRTPVYPLPFASLPPQTTVIIDRGPNEIRTTLVMLEPVPATSVLRYLRIATPLPRGIAAGTRVDFEPGSTGAPIPRVNEWLSSVTPPRSERFDFSTPLNRKDYEIYQPPYFFKPGTRPVLPPLKPGEVMVRYGSTFTVRTPDAARITRVAIMRPAAVTHHTDTEQRFIELPFTTSGTTSLKVTMVPGADSSLVPPGYYMLWILDGALPCVEARFIMITGAPPLRSPSVPTEAPPPLPPFAPNQAGEGSDRG